MMEQFGAEYIVSSVGFQDEVAEITFFDKEKQGEDVAEVTTRLVKMSEFSDSFNIIVAELQDIINESSVMLRNPPKKLTPADRLRAGMSAREEDNDDDEGQ